MYLVYLLLPVSPTAGKVFEVRGVIMSMLITLALELCLVYGRNSVNIYLMNEYRMTKVPGTVPSGGQKH